MHQSNKKLTHVIDERMITMAENNQKHRHEVEKITVKARHAHISRGQWLGFFIALFFLATAAWLIYNGHDGAGIAIITIDIVGLVAVFVVGNITYTTSKKDIENINQ